VLEEIHYRTQSRLIAMRYETEELFSPRSASKSGRTKTLCKICAAKKAHTRRAKKLISGELKVMRLKSMSRMMQDKMKKQ
jgi:hypothetical protein